MGTERPGLMDVSTQNVVSAGADTYLIFCAHEILMDGRGQSGSKADSHSSLSYVFAERLSVPPPPEEPSSCALTSADFGPASAPRGCHRRK